MQGDNNLHEFSVNRLPFSPLKVASHTTEISLGPPKPFFQKPKTSRDFPKILAAGSQPMGLRFKASEAWDPATKKSKQANGF